MCDCIKTILDKVFDKTKMDLGTNVQLVEAPEVEQLAYIPKYKNMAMYNTISFKYDFEKTDGSRSKPRKKTVSLIHSFCPVCGVKNENE